MRVFLGITGASGAPYAARLLEALGAANLRKLATFLEASKGPK